MYRQHQVHSGTPAEYLLHSCPAALPFSDIDDKCTTLVTEAGVQHGTFSFESVDSTSGDCQFSSSRDFFSDTESVATSPSSPGSADTTSGDEVGFLGPESQMLMKLSVSKKPLRNAAIFKSYDAEKRRLLTNARERERMRSLNDAMDQLRSVVPHYPSRRRLSKMETLLLAQSYIMALTRVLQEGDAMSKTFSSDSIFTAQDIAQSIIQDGDREQSDYE